MTGAAHQEIEQLHFLICDLGPLKKWLIIIEALGDACAVIPSLMQ